MYRPIPIHEMTFDRLIAFWSRVDKSGECWLWTGYLGPKGYPTFCISAKKYYVYRIAYALAHGYIPTGMTIDHLCRTRNCVRPSHHEAVPQQVNSDRGNTISVINAGKTHCPAGHPYDEENTYRPPGAPNSRQCRTCTAARTRKRIK